MLRADDNMLVNFWNQEVFNTALESWALALQESTNKKLKAWRWWKLHNMESQRFFYMTVSVKMHFIECPTISICQVVLKLRPKLNSLRQKTSLLWICNEKVLPNASLACIFDLDTSCSVESLSFMQLLDICGSIIWFVVIFIHFHFIMLQNKLFERWIATVVL